MVRCYFHPPERICSQEEYQELQAAHVELVKFIADLEKLIGVGEKFCKDLAAKILIEPGTADEVLENLGNNGLLEEKSAKLAGLKAKLREKQNELKSLQADIKQASLYLVQQAKVERFKVIFEEFLPKQKAYMEELDKLVKAASDNNINMVCPFPELTNFNEKDFWLTMRYENFNNRLG